MKWFKLNLILNLAVKCLLKADETYDPFLQHVHNHYASLRRYKHGNNHALQSLVCNAPAPSMIAVLLEVGADPNALMEGMPS
jgi:hypothetical protein